MEWLSMLADDDSVVVREDTAHGRSYVVHSRRGPEFACANLAEAEARATACAASRGAHAWFADGRGFRLLLGPGGTMGASSTTPPVPRVARRAP